MKASCITDASEVFIAWRMSVLMSGSAMAVTLLPEPARRYSQATPFPNRPAAPLPGGRGMTRPDQRFYNRE
jgi:ABC-type uncharacterized transport system permease subunit